MPTSKSFAKCQRVAERCRQVKNWKPGSIFARGQSGAERAEEGSLYIYEAIGGWFGGVTADSVRQALDGLKGVDVLNIYVNSEGGDVSEAKAIYAQLQRFQGKKVVHVDGIAASAASFLAMAGDEVVTAPEATWMIHEAWGIEVGSAQDMRDYADILDMLSADIAAIYARKTGASAEEMRSLMRDETWMNAQQALERKFTDRIVSYTEDDESEKAVMKVSGAAALVETTQARIAAMQPELMRFRAERAAAMTKDLQMAQKGRASAAQRQQPASRS